MMRNRQLATAILILLVMGCKKTRTCTCTVTSSGTTNTTTYTPGFPPFVPESTVTTTEPFFTSNTIKTKYKDVRKSDMKKLCFDQSDESIDMTTVNSVPGFFSVTSKQTGTRTHKCKIE